MCCTEDGFTSLGLAIERGRNDMVKILAESGCALNKSVSPKDQCTALVCACIKEINSEPDFKLNATVATLIECGADITGNWETGTPGCPKTRGAWHRALDAKNVGAMEMLLAKRETLPKTTPSAQACTSQLESMRPCGHSAWGCCVAGRDTGIEWEAGGGNIADGSGHYVGIVVSDESVTSP